MAGDPSADAASSPSPQTAPRRKFAVEPVETSARSSKDKRQEASRGQSPPADRPRRRFLPQPVEETTKSSRRGGGGAAARSGEDSTGEKKDGAPTTDGNESAADKKPRKFAVQPVETVKRVRRRNSSGPALQPGDGTDESPQDKAKPRHLGIAHGAAPPANSPNPYDETAPQAPESRFSYAALARKSSRQSSMRKPTLEPISSVPESEESNFSKRSSTSSQSSNPEDDPRTLKSSRKKRQARQQENYEGAFNGYLLDIAAKAAQQQLREQVAEAYPNERLYDPVNHFAVDKDSDSDVEDAVGQLPDIRHEDFSEEKREASAGWSAADLKKHQAELARQKAQQEADEKSKKTHMALPNIDPTRISPSVQKKDPFGNAFNLSAIGEGSKDLEMRRMQDKARPPMLGGELVFPKSQSPRATIIDPLQRHGTRRSSGLISRDGSGLWNVGSPIMSTTRHESPRPSVCLWAGSCTADLAAKMKSDFPVNMQSGIMTPRYAPDEDPMERYMKDESLQHAQQAIQHMQGVKQQTILPQQAARNGAQLGHQLPANPSSRIQSVIGIDQMLAQEQKIEKEYPDSFVTQIYNYLSLGYPSIAHSFDEELSKISKISLEEIRRDDLRRNTKGHIGAPEGQGVSEAAVRDECGRWRALRLYIREWARQQPNMMDDQDSSWAARARRGSWLA